MASIRKRTWQAGGEEKTAWVADYFDQSGKRHIKTFSTRKAADAWLIRARDEVARGVHTAENGSNTGADAAGVEMEGSELEGVEQWTLRKYRNEVALD